VHAWPSLTHCVLEHTLPMHEPVQQSVFALHDEPGAEQVVGFALHVCAFGSQAIEQQSPSAVQP